MLIKLSFSNSPIPESIVNMPRSGSLTRLTNYFNQAAAAAATANQDTSLSGVTSRRSGPEISGPNSTNNGQINLTRASRSETSMKPRSASSSMAASNTCGNYTRVCADEQQQRNLEQAMKPLNADELYCGQGSVRNLVYSYEVFPLKERCDSDHKIRQLREEREREIQSVMEHKTGTSVAAQQQQIKMMLEEQQQQQQEMLRQLQLQQQQQQLKSPQQQQQPQDAHRQQQQQQQSLLRKELSTISERTEHSASHHMNLIGN